MATRKKYGIAIGSDTVAVFAGRANIYDSLKTDLGLIDAQGESIQSKKVIQTAVSNIPHFSRIGVSYQKSPTKVAVGRLVCATSKIEEAITGLSSKTYDGKSILKAYIPKRKYFV